MRAHSRPGAGRADGGARCRAAALPVTAPRTPRETADHSPTRSPPPTWSWGSVSVSPRPRRASRRGGTQRTPPPRARLQRDLRRGRRAAGHAGFDSSLGSPRASGLQPWPCEGDRPGSPRRAERTPRSSQPRTLSTRPRRGCCLPSPRSCPLRPPAPARPGGLRSPSAHVSPRPRPLCPAAPWLAPLMLPMLCPAHPACTFYPPTLRRDQAQPSAAADSSAATRSAQDRWHRGGIRGKWAAQARDRRTGVRGHALAGWVLSPPECPHSAPQLPGRAGSSPSQAPAG